MATGDVRRFGVAVVAVSLTTLVGVAIRAFGGLERVPFILLVPAIFVASRGGLGPGLLATAGGAVAIQVFLGDRGGHLPATGENTVGLLLFLAIGAAISALTDNLVTARGRARAVADDLERHGRELSAARAEAERLARDVTRRAQEFETIFEVAPIGIGIAADRECRMISVNRHLASMLRIGLAENASLTAPADERPSFTVLTPDGQPVAPDDLPLQIAARTGVPVRDVELDVRYPDGSYARLQEYAAPIFDEAGAVRGAIGAFIDVTERHRTAGEQQLLSDASRLLATALTDTHVLGSLPRLFVPAQADWAVLDVVDGDGRRRRLGVAHRDPAREVRLAAYAQQYPIDVRAAGRPGPLDLVGAGTSRLLQDVRDAEYVGQPESGEYLENMEALGTASGIVVPIFAQGRVAGAMAWARGADRPRFDGRDLAFGEEVARRAGIAVERVRLYREVQEANRLKDEFLATLSHEMRTPLNALLGWLQLLKSGQLPPEKTAKALDAIDRSASLQAQLTADLLDVSRAITGKLRLDRKEVHLGRILEDVADALRPAAESKGIALRLAPHDGLPPLVADPGRLQQIVHNLVSNAVKFTAAGEVAVDVRHEGNAVAVVVRDTGVGIRPEFLPFVFDRFRQGDQSPTREHGGLGLGLAIVRHLTELHGGTVTATSEGPGTGATFTVRLPVRA
jgi:signal transduction histidine kinase/PAS domain-containing protein